MYASAQPTMEILGLFQLAEKLDVAGLSRAEIYERASHYLKNNEKQINFKTLPRSKDIKYDGDMPTSFKLRINDEALDLEINDILKKEFNLKRVMTPFKLKVVLSVYINYLEKAGVEDDFNVNQPHALNDLRVKAISRILKLNEEKLNSLNKYLEKEYIE